MTLTSLEKFVRDLLFGKSSESANSFFVLLSNIPERGSEREFSLVEFSRVDLIPRYEDMTTETFNAEARLFLATYDIEEIFESKEEARLFLESVSRKTVPVSDLRSGFDGGWSERKSLEFGVYKKIRPKEPILDCSTSETGKILRSPVSGFRLGTLFTQKQSFCPSGYSVYTKIRK